MLARCRLLIAAAFLLRAAAAHADDGRLVLSWSRDDKTDPLSGNVTVQAFASVDAPTGETIQVTATCNDGLVASLLGGDEELAFSVFQGNSAEDLNWNDSALEIEYKIDDQDTQTISVSEKYDNSITLVVAYADMSTAQKYAVELPLADGNTPVIEVNPTDPVMRAFTEVCKQQYDQDNPPAPPAPSSPPANSGT